MIHSPALSFDTFFSDVRSPVYPSGHRASCCLGRAMADELVIARAAWHGTVYTCTPALGLPIRCADGVWFAVEPSIGLVAFALARAGLRAAVAEQLDLLWKSAVLGGIASDALSAALTARITCRPALAVVRPERDCKRGCLGGQGCRCHELRKRR